MYNMDVEAFRAWLQSHDPQAVVGSVAQELACPVACWMNEVYQRVFGVVGMSVFTYDDLLFDFFFAPLWATRFVAELDSRYDCHPVSVSAADALVVLDGVLLEVGYGS